MSIGLLDGDIIKYGLLPFNLEIMKLSTYFKKRGELVTFSPNFEVERHTKFYYRQDWYDGEFPPQLTAQNVEYGGLAFSNNCYIPMNEDVERCRADPMIYTKIESRLTTKKEKSLFSAMALAQHLRLSLDGKNVWPQYTSQLTKGGGAPSRIFLHDYDLGSIKGAYDEVARLLNNHKTKLCTKFPIQTNDEQSLLKWSTLNADSALYSLQFNGILSDDFFYEWLPQVSKACVFRQMVYHITDKSADSAQVIKALSQIYHQILISRSFGVNFSLNYDRGFFEDDRWEGVLKLLNSFLQNGSRMNRFVLYKWSSTDTLMNFASFDRRKYPHSSMTNEEIRATMDFVKQFNEALYYEFCNTTSKKLEEDYVTRTNQRKN